MSKDKEQEFQWAMQEFVVWLTGEMKIDCSFWPDAEEVREKLFKILESRKLDLYG